MDRDSAVAFDSDDGVAGAEIFGGVEGPEGLEAAPVVADVRVGARVKDETVMQRVNGCVEACRAGFLRNGAE